MPAKKQPLATIGARLHHFRTTEAKLSQNKFAESVGIDSSYYSRIERDDAGLAPDKAENIANVYHVNLNWLYLGKGDVYQQQELGVAETTRAFVSNIFAKAKKAQPSDLKEAGEILSLLDAYIMKKNKSKKGVEKN